MILTFLDAAQNCRPGNAESLGKSPRERTDLPNPGMAMIERPKKSSPVDFSFSLHASEWTCNLPRIICYEAKVFQFYGKSP